MEPSGAHLLCTILDGLLSRPRREGPARHRDRKLMAPGKYCRRLALGGLMLLALCGSGASAEAAPFSPANAGPGMRAPSVPGFPLPRLELDCPLLAVWGFSPRRALNPLPLPLSLPLSLSLQPSPTVVGLQNDASHNGAPIYRVETLPQADRPRPATSLPTSVPNERSGWAQWNSSLPGVTTTVMVFLVTMVGGFTLLPKHATGWSQPQFSGLEEISRRVRVSTTTTDTGTMPFTRWVVPSST